MYCLWCLGFSFYLMTICLDVKQNCIPSDFKNFRLQFSTGKAWDRDSLVIFAVLKTKQLLSAWPVQSLFHSQFPGVRECSVWEYIKEGRGHEGRGLGGGGGGLIRHSKRGLGQTISGIQLPCTPHVSGMQQYWPTSPHWETIYGPRDGKRTCIKQGCAPGVSVWTGSMGAENSLTQKASYEIREGKQRGEALLDTWRGWWIHQ